ncbi:hypothetical protein [Streptomyces longispororuber]|uniref:hypothetical protein n=1 Tax=Streptomyces longispororuber TaxID=68230 RepID=UPI00210B3DB1|nr:hypothetical protein [Streptomyces longispororuber]MCQ4212338.1 hypothetical protein [Streptomyces longispororuber]
MNFNESGSQTPGRFRTRVRAAARWLHRRRHIAALDALRGASYSAGTSVVAVIVWWVESRH